MNRPLRLEAMLPAMLALACGSACASAPVAATTVAPEPAAPAEGPALPILSNVLVSHVKSNYFDPHRIVPKAMLAAALEHMEMTVPEIMVEGDVASGMIKVTVAAAIREFDVSRVDSLYQLQTAMAAVMGFVQEHPVTHKNLGEIEYAAVNGMLSALDPHSLLIHPRLLREMRLHTRRDLGGLGFVIAMRDGNLTVVKTLRNTPAQRAGIKPRDVITEIEEQSTVNMDLQEAVDRLRGRPGSTVAMSVVRPGSTEPRRLQLVREVVSVETIPFAKVLDTGVGYVKVSGFSSSTTRDLRAAIDAERIQAGGNLRGLILDLRGNPGGLLEQAVEVSDLFLSSGLIVRTVGHDRRDVQAGYARPHRHDLADLPMVVMVDNGSAAASEIVASALRDNDRALVVGRQTFGNGSVQVLYDDLPGPPGEAPALKLTVYQFLTAAGVSIHKVGVTPDVLLLPGRAMPDAVNWFAPRRSTGEADLDDRREKSAEGRPRAKKAALELRYLLDEKEAHVAKGMKAEQGHRDGGDLTPQQLEAEAGANPEELVEDYPIRFAKELLARAPFAKRAPLLEAARQLVAERTIGEESRVQARLAQMGVSWSAGPATDNPRAVVTVSPPPGERVQAGDTVPWTVTVENRGDGPFHRLRAWTVVDANPSLDRREFLFGLVKPGEKRNWTVPLKLPRSLDSRRDDVTVHFEADSGRAPPDVATSFEVVQQPRPLFAFSTQVDDEAAGNGDGTLERGEEVALRVDVGNVGAGASGEKTYVSVKNLGGEKVFIKKGRAAIGALTPGEVKTALLPIEVKKGFELDRIPLRLQIADEEAGESVSERIELPVPSSTPARTPVRGGIRVAREDTLLKSGADDAAAPLALAKKGAVLPASARMGDYYKVEWRKGRFGFAAAGAVQVAPKAKREGHVAEIWQREPPRIALVPDPAKDAPVVDGERWRIEGTASTPPPIGGAGTPLRDVFIVVNGRKVFFKVVPEGSPASSVDFTAEFALKLGSNRVTVHARGGEELQAQRTVHVYRRPPARAAR